MQDESSNQYFLMRFWGNFVKIPQADQILYEDLLNKSLSIILQGLKKMNSLIMNVDSGNYEYSLTDRDFFNIVNILDFCVKHDYFPNFQKLKSITDQLLLDYEHNAYKLRHET